jgi:hypothetical protein
MQSDTWKNDFFHQGNFERSTTVFYAFTWPTGRRLEDFGVNEILTLAHHINRQLSTSDTNNECKQALCNERYEFKVLGRGKKLNEHLGLALANDKRFPILRKLLSIVSELLVSTVCC